MPDKDNDLFGEDENEAIDEFDRLSELLIQRVSEFAEEEDVPDAVLSELLFRLSLTMRMTGYVLSVAKPSGAGLKLDLDRFRREIEELMRTTKKDADPFVARAKLELAATGQEEDET